MALVRDASYKVDERVAGLLPLADSSVVYRHSALGLSSGRVRALQSGDTFAGFAGRKVDSRSLATGASPEQVPIIRKGEALLTVSGAVSTSVGASVYATDDGTFGLTSGSVIGVVVRVPSDGTAVVAFSAIDQSMPAALSSAMNDVGAVANAFCRWCIPGKDTSGTLFKDVSGRGNDATIEASNTGAFATDNRMATIAHASAGGIVLQSSASSVDLLADSLIMSFMMTNEDPAGSESVASWGAGAGGANAAGFYFSHRSSAAGVGRIVANRGNGTLVSGSDSTVKFSNAGGTRETHVCMAYDAPTGSMYLYRDGVLAASNVGAVAGANAFTTGTPGFAARLGATGGTAATVAGIFRGWQGYVFTAKALPLNIGRIAAMLAESPSVPLMNHEFAFA